MGLKQVYEKWTSINLVVRIVAGLVIGAVLALVIPGIEPITLLGTIFVNALKAIAPILVFVLIASSLAGSGSGLGSKFEKVLILYIGSTVVAAAVAVILSYAFPLTVTLIEGDTSETVSSTWELLSGIIAGIFTNPVTAIMDGNYLSILFWSALVGFVIKAVRSETLKNVFQEGSVVVTRIIRIIIVFSQE